MTLSIEVRGERLDLLPERALYLPRTGTLLVADPHFGKAASFRAMGVPVPAGTTGETLARLDAVVSNCRPARLVFLGDFLHARAGRNARTLDEVRRWRTRRAGIEMLLVRGNHDRSAGDPPPELEIRCVDEPTFLPPFALCHGHSPRSDGYVLAGHLHPAIVLRGATGERLRLPCFLVGDRAAVLPAFGAFTGAATVAPAADQRVFVVAEDAVVEIPPVARRAARPPVRRRAGMPS